MIQKIDPVFFSWYTKKQIGTGTDGKVFSIEKDNSDGTSEISSLKIIRIGENKSDRKSVYQSTTNFLNEDDYYQKTIKSITDNIDIVMQTDAGRHFVKYEEYEKRKASDSKGWLILIRFERMKSLSELLEEFSFTHDEVVRLGISLCQSLIKCRSFGYIYPNLKPENVLFDKNGVCKLGDFGTFSLLEPSRAAIAYKRTEYYMAPEFIKSGKVNCTIDTYSLGLILYMLVNRNRLPFVEPYPQNVTINSLNKSKENRMQANALPKPLLASDELEKIINKACNPKENKRYLSPKQMLSDLKKILKDDLSQVVNEELEDNDSEIHEELEDDVQTKFVSTAQKMQQIYTDEQIEQGIEEKETQDEIELEQTEEIVEVEEYVSLKDEISIPNVKADTYHGEKEKKDQPTTYAQLPKIKRVAKVDSRDIRKILVLVFIAVFFLSLCLISMSLMSAQNEQLTILNDILYNNERWGILQWLTS
ncbi:MAG: protein kinase [Clostridia bacterium]